MSTRPDGNFKRARLEPVAVLADRYTRDLIATWVYVAPINDRKLTSTLVKQLTAEFPLDHLQHLKRVRNVGNSLEIILCKDDGDLEAVSKIKGIDETEIRKQAVSLHVPSTRLQFEKSCLLWPTQFHEDKEIRQMLDGSFFSALELEKVARFMQIVVEKAVDVGQIDANIVLVVNPKTARVLAIGKACLDKHPVLHATMVALDSVARRQGGGAWKTELPEQEVEADGQVPVEADYPYLCTGYDVYLLREPCTMCAMALVHSRIRRAFYGVSDVKRGSLGSRFKIHCLGGLNHSFQVWKNVMSDECHAALCGDFKKGPLPSR